MIRFRLNVPHDQIHGVAETMKDEPLALSNALARGDTHVRSRVLECFTFQRTCLLLHQGTPL